MISDFRKTITKFQCLARDLNASMTQERDRVHHIIKQRKERGIAATRTPEGLWWAQISLPIFRFWRTCYKRQTERSTIAIVRTVISNELEDTKGLHRAKIDTVWESWGRVSTWAEEGGSMQLLFCSVLSIENNDLQTGKEKQNQKKNQLRIVHL